MGFLSILGSNLYSEVAGHGEPVLLLHGGFCSLESLRAQSDALVDSHTVLAYERPGHGRSADIEGEYSYSSGVLEALAYLDANGVDSAHIVGYSDGAIIGLLLASLHPSRVRSLVAISGNLDAAGFSFSATDAPQLSPLSSGEGQERAYYDALSPDGPEHGDVVMEKLFRLWTSSPAIEPSSLATITAPTLVMSGDHDSIRVDHSLLIAASIPGAQLCIVPGATHGLVAEKPEFIAGVITEFLQSF
jgi:pimeloyl-ACP methyl ester carboxylesterase